MESGVGKIIAAILLILLSITLDVTSTYSPFKIGQLVISFSLAIAGALVGFKGLVDFLSNRF